MPALLAAGAVWLAAGCDGCGGPPDELRVEGEHPFVRCLAAEPPEARRWDAGGQTLEIEGRTLRLIDAPRPLRWAAFAGPAPSENAVEETADALSRRTLHLAVVVGNVGDDVETARRTMTQLGAIGIPVLVLAGGRDESVVLTEAFDALSDAVASRVIDARAISRVRVGSDVLVTVSGTPKGRYARSKGACGYTTADIDEVIDRLEGDRRRWLVSWSVPAGDPLAAGMGGVDAGDPALARLVEEGGIAGGVFAWPVTQVGRAITADGEPVEPGRSTEGLRVVVPPIAGPTLQRADGNRVQPGPVLLTLRQQGLAIQDAARGAP